MRILKDGERANASVLNRPHFDRGLVKMHTSEYGRFGVDTSGVTLGGSGTSLTVSGSLKIDNHALSIGTISIPVYNEPSTEFLTHAQTITGLPAGALGIIPDGYAGTGVLKASDLSAGDQFGTSVAISGNRVLVGANYKDAGGIYNSGQVYVYEWNSGTGKYDEIQKLTASDPSASDEFGTSVAISGNRVLVGARYKDAGGIVGSGQVYVYEWNSGTGKYDEIQKLTASDPSASDVFGFSVAISGNRVLVGAYDKDAGGLVDSGQVYVYDWNSGTSRYVEIQKLTASDPSASDNFGYAVAISGNRVLVGAIYKDAGGIVDSGQVYVYEWNSGTSKYDEIQKLTAGDPSASDVFGTSVAISGNRVLVGARGKDAGGLVDSGQVYVYDWNSGTSRYVEIQKLTASDPSASDNFGRSVAISGNRVLVGAFRKDAGGIVDSGQVYVYDESPVVRIPKSSLAAGTSLTTANSYENFNIGKEGIVFLEIWKESISTDGQLASSAGFVQSSALGSAVSGTYYNAQVGQSYAAAKALNWNAATDAERKTLAANSILLYSGNDFEQLKFRVRIEYGAASTTIKDFKAQGANATVSSIAYAYDTETKMYKSTVSSNVIYAVELGRISL